MAVLFYPQCPPQRRYADSNQANLAKKCGYYRAATLGFWIVKILATTLGWGLIQIH